MEERSGSDTPRRGDGFDIGGESDDAGGIEGLLPRLLSNPSELVKSLNINETQAKNIRSFLIVSPGTGFGHKYLSDSFGGPLAAAISAFVAAWIADKVIKKRQ